MRKTLAYLLFICLATFVLLGFTYLSGEGEWGFFGHRKINRLAVFTLPPPMVGFYKNNIHYLTEHAVDPDKRRHASKYEAVRHYIDIDHWDAYPFENIPRKKIPALLQYATMEMTDTSGNRIIASLSREEDSLQLMTDNEVIYRWQKDDFYGYFADKFMPHYYDDEWNVNVKDNRKWPVNIESVTVVDSFSQYGILPYHLLDMQRRLTKAMTQGDKQRIIRLSADYGHYIADGHVPLHTTENYNGQLTGQDGIHAFWESRIPELFSEKEYDFFVGKAEYIPDLRTYVWDIIMDSHLLVDSVLTVEKKLRLSFPEDKQYCYSDRNGRTIRQPCKEFAKAYQDAMGDMVEQRMRQSIKAIGNLWYTAWVNAGQPDLEAGQRVILKVEKDSININAKQLGREHAG